MRRAEEGLQRVVVKVGSSVLTDEAGRLLPTRLEGLVDQISTAVEMDSRGRTRHVVLVSSGAIACGMARLNIAKRPTALAQLQACAAVGQGELMALYARVFAARGVVAGQVLLTQEDLASRTRFRNAKQTLLALLHRRVVPVVNENDTVAVEEITFGDNDRLAALVASAIQAQLLVLLTDVDGFLLQGRPIQRAETLDHLRSALRDVPGRQTTKGGMASKLEAARIVGHSGIPMVIANGHRPHVLTDLLQGQSVGTLFVPPRRRLTSRKWWIAFALRQPKGTLVVDDGAARAVADQGRSLLASGILDVKGQFESGMFVAVVDRAGKELARGVSWFSSADLERVRGLQSADIARLLGKARAREVIHRDSLVLAKELSGSVNEEKANPRGASH